MLHNVNKAACCNLILDTHSKSPSSLLCHHQKHACKRIRSLVRNLFQKSPRIKFHTALHPTHPPSHIPVTGGNGQIHQTTNATGFDGNDHGFGTTHCHGMQHNNAIHSYALVRISVNTFVAEIHPQTHHGMFT